MAKDRADQFVNRAVIGVTESAANTLTFKKLETGISLFEKLAWIIHRIEYTITPINTTQFNATGDYLDVALTATDQMSSISVTNSAVLDYVHIERIDIGTAASGGWMIAPIVKDLMLLPGGGLLVPPNPLYLGLKGYSLVGVATCYANIYYTNKPLAADEYWELVESRRIISAT